MLGGLIRLVLLMLRMARFQWQTAARAIEILIPMNIPPKLTLRDWRWRMPKMLMNMSITPKLTLASWKWRMIKILRLILINITPKRTRGP